MRVILIENAWSSLIEETQGGLGVGNQTVFREKDNSEASSIGVNLPDDIEDAALVVSDLDGQVHLFGLARGQMQ